MNQEGLHQERQPPRAEPMEESTPERLFWKEFEPTYMEEEVPDHDHLKSGAAALEEDAQMAMDKVAAFAIAAKKHIEMENTGASFFALVEQAHGEGAITLEEKECIEGWFRPTNRRKLH